MNSVSKLFLLLILGLLSCGKSGDDLSELNLIQRNYVFTDSINVYQNLSTNLFSSDSFHIQKDASLMLSGNQQILWFQQDTFILNPGYGYILQDSFPVIKLQSDSITKITFLSDTNFKRWSYSYGHLK